MAKIWGMLSQGDEITITEEMDGLVGEERMELREEQVQFVRKRKKKKNRFYHHWPYLEKSLWTNVSRN